MTFIRITSSRKTPTWGRQEELNSPPLGLLVLQAESDLLGQLVGAAHELKQTHKLSQTRQQASVPTLQASSWTHLRRDVSLRAGVRVEPRRRDVGAGERRAAAPQLLL